MLDEEQLTVNGAFIRGNLLRGFDKGDGAAVNDLMSEVTKNCGLEVDN